MQDIRELIESFFTWLLMGIGFAVGAFFGFLLYIFFAIVLGCTHGNWFTWFFIAGTGIGGAQGFTFVKWLVMRHNKKVWQRLDWTANAIEIPSVICNLSVILSSATAGSFLLQLLLYKTIESDATIFGKMGAIIGAVIALGVIFFQKIKNGSLVKNKASNIMAETE